MNKYIYRDSKVNTPKRVTEFLQLPLEDNEGMAVNFILQGMSENKIVQSWESVILLLNNLEKSYLKEMTLVEVKSVLERCKEFYNEEK